MRAAAIALATLLPLAATAGEAWDDIRAQLYGARPINDAAGAIAIDAPYRSPDDARVPIKATVAAPDGLRLGAVTVILDQNPMPVSAVVRFEDPPARAMFESTMRVNGPTPLRVIAETTDGRLWMAESYVKTSGLGACSAPPGTDPKDALATLGRMTLTIGELEGAGHSLRALVGGERRLDVDIDHPSHSGMQMDQISLLFIPMRYVDQITIDLDGAPYAQITGSISLSENPSVGLSIPARTRDARVRMRDTDGTVTQAQTGARAY